MLARHQTKICTSTNLPATVTAQIDHQSGHALQPTGSILVALLGRLEGEGGQRLVLPPVSHAELAAVREGGALRGGPGSDHQRRLPPVSAIRLGGLPPAPCVTPLLSGRSF